MSWLFGRKGSKSPEDQFADEMAALGESVMGFKVTRTEGFALHLEREGNNPIVMNLGNIFAETQKLHGAERQARLRNAVLAMVPPPRPETWDEAAPKLMPAVRAVSWLSASGSMTPVNRTFMPFLRLLCAIDGEHALTYVTDEDIGNWGVSEEQPFETAAANLSKAQVEVHRVGPIGVVTGPDGYASSWLAAPDRLHRIAADIGSSVIAVAASRDSLVLVDSANAEAAAKVLETELHDYLEAPRQLSPVPYLVGETGIAVWDPPRGDAMRGHVHKAQHLLAHSEYGHQREMLDKRFIEAGQDIFVAGYDLVQRKDGSMWTWAPWVKQVASALVPQVEFLLLGDSDDKASQFAVRWDDALRLAAGALERDPAMDPPLWRYRGWPSATVLAALRAQAVPFPPPPDV